MAMTSFQFENAQHYLGSGMNNTLQVPPAGGYRNPQSELSGTHVRPLTAVNNSSAGQATAWETSHTGTINPISAQRFGTFINFNTSQVDPTVR